MMWKQLIPYCLLLGIVCFNTGCEQETNKSSQKAVPIETDEAFHKAIQSEQPVLVEFYLIGCSYCKRQEKMIEALAAELAGKTKVYVLKLTRANKDVYKVKYGFKYVPRCAVFKNGTLLELLDKSSEKLTKEDLKAFVARHQ